MKEIELREAITKLVKEFYTEKFGQKEFNSGESMVHYAGRVFDENLLYQPFVEIAELVVRHLKIADGGRDDRFLVLPKFVENIKTGRFVAHINGLLEFL